MSDADPGMMEARSLASVLRTRAHHHRHLIKYFLIGVTASAIDVVLFLILFNWVGTSALAAHSVSVPTAVLFSFVVNARHNFRTVDYPMLRLFSFVVVCTIGYVSGYAVIEAAIAFGSDANIGKIVSLPVVFAIQYILNSKITFRKAPRSPAECLED